jgi:Putative restriction endonuclease
MALAFGLASHNRASLSRHTGRYAMTVAVSPTPTFSANLAQGDYLSIHRGCTWEQFKLIQKGFENTPWMRLSYYNGTIEILTPGIPHEIFKKNIAVLVEAFLFDRDIECTPTGSGIREKAGVAALEPDESYVIGDALLAIEINFKINFTSGDASKLERYQALGVDEVWFWEDGVLLLYHLRPQGYEPVERSQIPELAGIDMAVLSRCILQGETSIAAARKAFRSAHPLAR